MKTKSPQTALLLSLALLGAALPLAAEPTLKVGDPAPKLQTGKWVQGEPVKTLEKGKAYLVEFWATWCGPCITSIPHLNEIHLAYKDKGLVVIGQDCWERNDDLVKPFVEKMGDKMTYRVALDDKESNERGMMAETWMTAAGRGGIPSAFLVDTQGRIAWMGHPMSLKNSTIEAVLDGTFDVKQAAADHERQQKNEAALRGLWTDMNRAMQQKNWEEAEARLAEMEKLQSAEAAVGLSFMRLRILAAKEDYDAAYALALKISDENTDNAQLQNEIAWQIATGKMFERRDLDVAEKIALRANDAAKGQEPAILDTLARIWFMQGKRDKAIETQQKAVALADDEVKTELQKVLDSYKQGKVPDGN